MKQAYRNIELRGNNMRLVETMNAVIADYVKQGFVLTVRQLYYQLVARDIIPNTEQSYKRVASIINDARIGGYMDWDAIEDRTRDVAVRSRWGSGADIVQAAANSFHMDMWVGQEHRMFVIVEKQALAGVLERVCNDNDVPLLAARGYPSVTVVRGLVLEHLQPAIDNGQTPVILHLGDHDPSGLDMTRDLEARIEMFLEDHSSDYVLRRIALNMNQINELNPPANPAKTTDARFKNYSVEFGDESWELDALEPRYLTTLVQGWINEYVDRDMWQARVEEIEDTRTSLNDVATEFRDRGVA